MLAIFEAQIDCCIDVLILANLTFDPSGGQSFSSLKNSRSLIAVVKRFEIAIAININRNFEPSCKSTKTQSIDVSLFVLQRGWNTLIPKFTSISILGSEVRIVDVVEFV